MFKKILIANRGEIAVRIIRTCQRLGITTVAVYSDVDARSLHVRAADEAVHIGPAAAAASYLAMEKIVAVAREHGCEAIHPGYGFLSENAAFAAAVARAGMVFIGPSAAVIATMGDKIAAKRMAIQAGVPVVPGHNQAVADLDEIAAIVEAIGYPIIFKPAAGGGGRGMRVVTAPSELASSLSLAQSETRKAFGDDRIFLERYITAPRHIEIQIMADQHGKVVSLGERECSVQRRHQKVIEEAPSPAITPELRQKMGELACALAREAGYANAGTVEFILDQSGDFFFMEMNTRLQVEHPVTEMVTGLDLVELQLKVANNEPLPICQEEVRITGSAIEARICAEDPGRNFLPATGIVTRYSQLHGRGLRLDSGIEAGSQATVYYDSLLAKVIFHGATREEARRGLVQALNRYHLEGVTTNIDFANAILNHPAFIAGQLDTGFIDQHFVGGTAKAAPAMAVLEAMAIAATLIYHNRQNLMRDALRPIAAKVGPARQHAERHSYVVKGELDTFQVELHGQLGQAEWQFTVNGTAYAVVAPEFEFYRRRLRLDINGLTEYFRLQYRENFIWAAFCGLTRIFEIYTPREWELAQYMPFEKKGSSDKGLISPLPGLVVGVLVKSGDRVYRGQDLLVIESMKMESGVPSPRDAIIDQVCCRIGAAVNTGDPLITFMEDAP
jgi:propionyl-CoA carboxylase alpha chain